MSIPGNEILVSRSYSPGEGTRAPWGSGWFSPSYLRAKSLQLGRTLCDPMDGSPPGFSVHGILQARILEWVAMPPSRDIFPTQGPNQCLLCLLHWQAGSLPLAPPGKPVQTWGRENMRWTWNILMSFLFTEQGVEISISLKLKFLKLWGENYTNVYFYSCNFSSTCICKPYILIFQFFKLLSMNTKKVNF